MECSFKALGTQWWIEIFDELDDKTSDKVRDFVAGVVTTYEANYSRFKPDSHISVLNRDRVLKNPSSELVKLLDFGKQLYLRSDTHFNFLTGHMLEAKGYDANYSFQDTQLHETAGNPITDIHISDKLIELRHGNIDLGGFGKGYLIDLLANELTHALKLDQFLINGGGDMYATHQNSQAIEIHLEHPTNQGSFIASTTLLNQGFAASSPHRRVWQNSTGAHHHIIAKTITTDGTYVKATTAVEADAFATTILQMDRPGIESLAQNERLAVAQFNATTSLLTKSRNFD